MKLKLSITILVITIFLINLVSALTFTNTTFFSSVSNSTIFVDSITLDQVTVESNWTEFYDIQSTSALLNNTNITYNAQAHIFNLTNALIYYSNNSIAGSSDISSNDNNINITLAPNNYSYVLDNFNLTEGVTRENSPLWFSLSTTTKKHIASNLTDTINATIVFNVEDCDISSINYVSDSGITSSPSFTCENNITTISQLNDIEQASSSNVITINYITEANNACLTLVTQFGAYPVLIGLVGTVILLGAIIILLITGFIKINSLGFDGNFVFKSLLIVISLGILVVVAIVIFGSICVLL